MKVLEARRQAGDVLRQIGDLRQPAPSRWPVALAFAIGLIAGAGGYFIATQRSQIKGVAWRTLKAGRSGVSGFGEVEDGEPVSVSSRRSINRRRAEAEVT